MNFQEVIIDLDKPVLKEVKSRVGEQAGVIKIDVDENGQLAYQFQIQSVPTLILFKDGEVKWRRSGVQQASELERIIKENL